jgi:hypothetical protein
VCMLCALVQGVYSLEYNLSGTKHNAPPPKLPPSSWNTSLYSVPFSRRYALARSHRTPPVRYAEKQVIGINKDLITDRLASDIIDVSPWAVDTVWFALQPHLCDMFVAVHETQWLVLQ